MKARLKVAAGCVIAIPSVMLWFDYAVFIVQHPWLTQMQIFNVVGWEPIVAIIALLPSGYLIGSGFAEDEDE